MSPQNLFLFKAMLGDLPADFLRVEADPTQQQLQSDEQLAQRLQAGTSSAAGIFPSASTMARLTINIVQVHHHRYIVLEYLDHYAESKRPNFNCNFNFIYFHNHINTE